MKNLYLYLSCVALSLLAACGSENTEVTDITHGNISTVSSFEDLPDCNDDSKDETILVAKTGTFYACNGEVWSTFGDSTVVTRNCDSKINKDSTGFVISCDGDSVGFISNGANGAKGTDGKDGIDGKTGVTCSVVSAVDSTVYVACGTDTVSLSLTNQEALEDSLEAIEKRLLSGMLQKGPFLHGSEVTAYGLENGKTLKQTGTVFSGTIESDDGEFEIASVRLPSQYAYLVAKGYYRNEVTGENSKTKISLRALTDLSSDRSKVNVNLLTHLEYDRVVYLVTREGMKVKAAKKQAEREIFNAFNVDAGQFGYSEDLNIFGTSDANAALLAISILLQGENDESDLSVLFSTISEDIAEDGVWDDTESKKSVLSWAVKLYVSDLKKTIRKNIEDWNLGTVPNFESVIDHFVVVNLISKECSTDLIDSTYAIDDAYDMYQYYRTPYKKLALNRVKCGSSLTWRLLTESELDMEQLICEEDGSLLKSNVAVSNRIFVCDDGNPRLFHNRESLLNKACLGKNEGEEMSLGLLTYACWDHHWVLNTSDKLEYFTDDRDGTVYASVKIGDLTWMAENLNYTDTVAYPNLQDNVYCPDSVQDSCAKYGAYYTWTGAMNLSDTLKSSPIANDEKIQGVCPDGWRLPLCSDFTSLSSKINESHADYFLTGVTQVSEANNSSGLSLWFTGMLFKGFISENEATLTLTSTDGTLFLYGVNSFIVTFDASDGGCNGSLLTSSLIPVRCVKD